MGEIPSRGIWSCRVAQLALDAAPAATAATAASAVALTGKP